MARRFRRRAPFRRSRGRASPFAGPVSGGRGLEWYLLAFDCCGIDFTVTHFDVNACGALSGWAFQARTIFPTVVDGGILTIERIRGDIQIQTRVYSNDQFGLPIGNSSSLMRMGTGLPSGGFVIPEPQMAIDIRSTIAGQRVSPQMWEIGDGESPTWMYRSHMCVRPDIAWDQNDLDENGDLETTLVCHEIDVKVKRRIDIGSHDLELQYGFPICDVEALAAQDIAKLAFLFKARVHLRMLARTGPGN